MPASRRQLTILICDIVDSTRYADGMDPEDCHVLLTIFFETCKRVVEDHRGLYAHHTGDGFIAYFGSPRTRGQHAQEAIACGRAIIEALSQQEFPGGIRIQVRVGVATGLVVVSDLDQVHGPASSFAIGAAVHLAARIQVLAAPSTVCVDATSRQLARRYFEFSDKGSHRLKGFAEPARVWEVGPPRPVEFRFEERRERLSPLVGRREELVALDRCWDLARQGHGQVALISGEAGIGKSRLVFEMVERIARERLPLVLQCLESHESEPLHPWINHMRHVAQVAANQSPEERRRRIAAVFDRSFPDHAWLRPFVLSLVAPGGGTAEQDDLSPAHKLDALRVAIVDNMLALDGAAAKVIAIEDLHWIDPSSEAMLEVLIRRVAGTRVLLLATCRTVPPAAAAPGHVTHLAIPKLSPEEAVALARHMIEGVTVAKPILAQFIERSDGIPLYIEEMARAVSDAGRAKRTAKENGGWKSPVVLPIPETLQGTLLARLDGLGEARDLAQIASVVGRDFEVEVLAKLAAKPKEVFERDLKKLLESGLVRPLDATTPARLEFRHALIREAAYSSLLHRDAVNLHSELARIYERDYPDVQNARPETLAQHLTISGRWADAASLWLQAGISAKEMGSATEALTRLDRCLQCLDSAGSPPQTLEIRMRCQMAQGTVISVHFGPVDRRAHEALSEAAALAETLGDATAMVESLVLLSIVKYNSGDLSAASAVAQQLVEYGARQGNERSSAIGMVCAGMCDFATGRFHGARSHLEQALAVLRHASEQAESYEGLALVYLGLTLHLLGDTAEAKNLCAVAVRLARERRASLLAAALGNSLYLHCMLGDAETARVVAAELADLAVEKGFPMWYQQAQFFLGWAGALAGERAGLDMMEAAMDRFRSAREMVEQSFFYGVLAESYLCAGDPQRALENVGHGRKIVDSLGERFFEAALLRLEARCLGNLPNAATPEHIAALLMRAEQIERAQMAAVIADPPDRSASA